MDKAHTLIEQTLSELRAMNRWSDRELFGIQLALEEAMINAVSHGNKRDKHKNVHFASYLSPDIVRFRVEDEGAGFNPDTVPDPTDAEHIEIASGRGVLLIRNFMSHVTYSERGNVLLMEKLRVGE